MPRRFALKHAFLYPRTWIKHTELAMIWVIFPSGRKFTTVLVRINYNRLIVESCSGIKDERGKDGVNTPEKILWSFGCSGSLHGQSLNGEIHKM